MISTIFGFLFFGIISLTYGVVIAPIHLHKAVKMYYEGAEWKKSFLVWKTIFDMLFQIFFIAAYGLMMLISGGKQARPYVITVQVIFALVASIREQIFVYKSGVGNFESTDSSEVTEYNVELDSLGTTATVTPHTTTKTVETTGSLIMYEYIPRLLCYAVLPILPLCIYLFGRRRLANRRTGGKKITKWNSAFRKM